MSAVFKDKIDIGKKLFYTTAVLDILVTLYYLIDIDSGQSVDFSYVDLVNEIPSLIFVLYII